MSRQGGQVSARQIPGIKKSVTGPANAGFSVEKNHHSR